MFQNSQKTKSGNSVQNNSQNYNWYTRLHRSPNFSNSLTDEKSANDRLNLSIFFRIWLALVAIILIASSLVYDQLFERVEPTSKQVIEDTLVDTGKLLSATFLQPLQSGQLQNERYQAQLDKAFAKTADNPVSPESSLAKLNGTFDGKFNDKATLKTLSTWFNQKTHSSFRVYVTDSKGKVIYDSLPNDNGNAEGQDYSQWNDVYLTLQGKYGARSSRNNQADSDTTVMYVAQPITNAQGKLIGVVSVGKPVATILPYINVARQRMLTTSISIMVLSILFAGLVAWWLQQSIAMVTRYTRSLATDTAKPSFYLGKELNELTDTIEDMKHKLENKSYVTDYVHTLTHELKSPLTAIKASGELLADVDLDAEDRQLLSQTIGEQSEKLQSLIDRLLLLAKVEQPNFRLDTQPINAGELILSLVGNQLPRMQKRELSTSFTLNGKACTTTQLIEKIDPVLADEFWLSQAVENLISNAIFFADKQIDIDFAVAPTTGTLAKHQTTANAKPKNLTIKISNDGASIPEYALDKVFDRYFSLSHQANSQSNKNRKDSNHKGNGLGLTLAKQVLEHHNGQISISNNPNGAGVTVTLVLPIAQTP